MEVSDVNSTLVSWFEEVVLIQFTVKPNNPYIRSE